MPSTIFDRYRSRRNRGSIAHVGRRSTETPAWVMMLPRAIATAAEGNDMAGEDEDERTYAVVVNDEEQFSIWLDARPTPDGWHKVGVVGGKQECLDHIEKVWTDMRPLSLRKWMQEQAR
jgi:MbtH protein